MTICLPGYLSHPRYELKATKRKTKTWINSLRIFWKVDSLSFKRPDKTSGLPVKMTSRYANLESEYKIKLAILSYQRLLFTVNLKHLLYKKNNNNSSCILGHSLFVEFCCKGETATVLSMLNCRDVANRMGNERNGKK